MHILNKPFSTLSPDQDIPALVTLWNAACGDEMSLSPKLAQAILQSHPTLPRLALLAQSEDSPDSSLAGFVLARQTDVSEESAPIGLIEALAVAPSQQNKGVGSQLLTSAEEWLVEQGCKTITVTLPEEMAGVEFLQRRGYQPAATTFDLANTVAHYQPPQSLVEIAGAVYPAQAGQQAQLLEFLQQPQLQILFPNAQAQPTTELDNPVAELQRLIQKGRRLSDLMILWTETGVSGLCWLGFEDSTLPIERVFPYRLPRPWAQLATLVTAADAPMSYARALLDAALRRLHNTGVNGCVLSGVSEVGAFEEFGFQHYRSWQKLQKK